jgi:uncharacterized membrane protein YiaA
MTQESHSPQKPTAAFIGASWLALVIGMGAYLIGLLNANIMLNEKGYYLTLLLFGLFSAISVQKAVRDRAEGIAVTGIYYGIAWFCVAASLILLTIGLWNSTMLLSEKGFYGVAMAMALFAATAVQKNVRDLSLFAADKPKKEEESTFRPLPFGAPHQD